MINGDTLNKKLSAQDGYISLAVNKISERGVLFFSSASNSGNKKHETSGVWEGAALRLEAPLDDSG